MQFISATLSRKVENLGAKLMKDYQTVGFQQDSQTEVDDVTVSIPKQVLQYYMETPTQYRMLYLLMFLFSN